MAAETLDGELASDDAAEGVGAVEWVGEPLSGGHEDRAVAPEGEAMFAEDRLLRVVVEEGDEGGGVIAGAEGEVDGEAIDAIALISDDGKAIVVQKEGPPDIRLFGIGEALAA